MTKKMALENALTVLESRIAFLSETDSTADATEAEALRASVETIEAMIAQLSKPRTPKSEEAKAKANAVRKEKTAAARAELLAKVVPVLRAHLAEDITAKALFEATKAELPEDFSAAKVQNILIREMAPELVKTEAKGKANTYRLA